VLVFDQWVAYASRRMNYPVQAYVSP
jgi:hypothetical protein